MFTFTQNALALLTRWFGGPSECTKSLKKKAVSGLVGFECPLRGERKLLLQQENLDSVLKSLSTLKPCMYLKSDNVNIENEGATGKIL